MDLEEEHSVYHLITDLSKRIVERHCPPMEHPYLPHRDDVRVVKKLRSKAFEILLNKTKDVQYAQEIRVKEKSDPVVEIQKFAFVLKLGKRNVSKVAKLNSLIDEFNAEDLQPGNIVYLVLQLLSELKSLEDTKEPNLNIFHYDNSNSTLPESLEALQNVPQFETYPMETFMLSDKLETMLDMQKCNIMQQTTANSVSRLCFYNQHAYEVAVEIQPSRCSSGVSWLPKCITDFCSRDFTTVSYLIPQIMTGVEDDRKYVPVQGDEGEEDKAELAIDWFNIKSTQAHFESMSDISSSHSLNNDVEDVRKDYNDIWDSIDPNDTSVCNYRTWETLGEMEPAKQPSFLTDNPNAMLYLTRIKQTSILLLLPPKVTNYVCLSEEVPIQEFLANVRLLLLGIESKYFKYDSKVGFNVIRNIAVHGISNESLASFCEEFIKWGNCFKFLTKLITPDSQSGKLQQEGLMFNAMCTSIREILVYYKAALLHIFSQLDKLKGLLKLSHEVRPIALLLTELTRLCKQDDEKQHGMYENSNILAMVYKEVTKVTLPQVALVFYTILKSCCDVYFQFLQKWLFEGVCNDVYGEFMIKEHSQYLRSRGHKFWTRGFSIREASVPGFLSGLAEAILQCGKAVRLLKICDPKNPICSVFTTSQPEVKVCMSTAMLRDQLISCQKYKRKGEEALGRIISLPVAIQDQKDAETEKANLVIHAQQDTLLRIKREKEESLRAIIENKKEFLKELKEQAKEAALHKEKERQAELLIDKLFMEKNQEKQKEINERERAERAAVIDHYAELNAVVQQQRARSEWRIRRMKHYQKRISAITEVKEELEDNNASDTEAQNLESNKFEQQNEQTEEIPVENIHIVLCNENNANSSSILSGTSKQDENSNFAEIARVEVVAPDAQKKVMSKESIKEQNPVISDTIEKDMPESTLNMNYIYRRNNERSSLQEFLKDEAMKQLQSTKIIDALNKAPLIITESSKETTPVDNKKGVNRPNILTIEKLDNMTAAQRNKMKVLQHEFGMTPNNNQANMLFLQTEENRKYLIIDTNNPSKIFNEHSPSNSNNNQIEYNYVTQCDMEKIKSTEITGKNDNAEFQIDNHLVSNTIEETNNINKMPSTMANSNIKNNEVQFPVSCDVYQGNTLETPMSCTTDNFTLSMVSSGSCLQTCDDTSPSDISSDMVSPNPLKLNVDMASASSKEDRFMIPTLFSLNTEPITPEPPSSLTLDDVELIDHTSLQAYLEKSIIIPLRIQSRIVNDAIIKYLLNEHNMLLHLQSLRSYFFLLNGEFAKCLTNSLYARLYEISIPIELFNSATLTNLLERALISSFNSNYVNSELLSLSAIDPPIQLYISDPGALDCLCLSYKISWPLNIILDDAVMLQYSKVFKFLVMIGRVLWVLQEDFRMMKAEHKAAISEQYHKLQLYRHTMTQFMGALHNYITCSVLHASWVEFEKDLRNSLTLDQVYLAHVHYIKRILSRCMLNTRGEKMRTCLNNIFEVILKFHNRLRSHNWVTTSKGYIHPNFKRLEQMYEAFCELRTYLSRVALKLTTSGYQPHLIHFLNTLNISHVYDLTEKTT